MSHSLDFGYGDSIPTLRYQEIPRKYTILRPPVHEAHNALPPPFSLPTLGFDAAELPPMEIQLIHPPSGISAISTRIVVSFLCPVFCFLSFPFALRQANTYGSLLAARGHHEEGPAAQSLAQPHPRATFAHYHTYLGKGNMCLSTQEHYLTSEMYACVHVCVDMCVRTPQQPTGDGLLCNRPILKRLTWLAALAYTLGRRIQIEREREKESDS
ncbi:hypothetical protein F4775DRAFT_555303 [Biscogniauxia sp. FL1348]|nr:hypothetical protein F4775DRAFT_555303 [Biscogniauxia sp. FL1348]